ncbi:MAG: hypothetical protein IJH95_02040 [Mogibacterium sp.]|nr:hypothetical protein [Mogibacterium sp.]
MDKSIFKRSFSLMIAVLMTLGVFCLSLTFADAESGIEEAGVQGTTETIDIPSVMWKGDSQHISVYSINGKDVNYAKITKVTSSDTAVVKKVKKIDYLKAVNTGEAWVTVNYKYSKTETGSRTVKVTVKKYPKQIKSLTFNGKKVDVSKKKYSYTVNKFSKTSLKIKMKLKEGWVISDAWGFGSAKGGSRQLNVTKAKIAKGGKISFPKKYKSANLRVTMKNKEGNEIHYDFYLYR